jgi:putative SOS response-associated peptidase YedK
MCYNYSIAKTADEIAARYNISFKPQKINPQPVLYHANGFKHPRLPVVYQDNKSGDLKLEFMQWGLIPSWTKGEDQALKIRGATLNARAETASRKPSFRAAFRYRPCFVPATGYFEWMHHKGKKYPFYIFLPGSPVFSIAGIWDKWINEESGEILMSFSILTCDANSFTGRIHNTKKRMPVILEQHLENSWFDSQIRNSEPGDILKPLDSAKMDAYTISRLITSRIQDSNVPGVLEPSDYPELEII